MGIDPATTVQEAMMIMTEKESVIYQSVMGTIGMILW